MSTGGIEQCEGAPPGENVSARPESRLWPGVGGDAQR
jgi:hypothetical protein